MSSTSIYKSPLCSCVICKSTITSSNLSKHHKSKQCLSGGKFTIKFKDVDKCLYCGISKLNKNSLAQHIVRCKDNPNRNIQTGGGTFNRPSWNQGLTKHTDDRILKSAKLLSDNIKSGIVANPGGDKISEYKLLKLSLLAFERELGGFPKWKRISYNGMKFDSTYEVSVVKTLEENNIKWERPKKLFYIDCFGKLRTYTADFYLPDYDVYLDPKNDYLINFIPEGGFSHSQKILWVQEQNKVVVLILTKHQLQWHNIKLVLQERLERSSQGYKS